MPSLGFGIERLGLPPLRHPKIALAIILLISAIAGIGLLNLQPSGSLSNLFRSHSIEYKDYQRLTELFPTSEYDIMLLVEGKDLMTPQKLEQLRDIQLELEFADGVKGIVSMFTVRGAPNKDGYAPPLFPADIPTGKAFEQLKTLIEEQPQIKGRFLSTPDAEGRQVAMMVVSLKEGTTSADKLDNIVGGIRKSVDEMAAPAGFKVMMTGVPILQLEIRNSIKHDRVTFNVFGFTLGVLITFYFFRRPTLVFISSICPAIAVLWTMGTLGHAGQSVTTFINVIPPLIMVITLSDAMHMVFSILKGLREGKTKVEATHAALLEVGPACVLTSLTTAIALLSMTLTDSVDIRAFGFAGAIGTMLAFVTVITVVPTLTLLMIRNEEAFLARDRGTFNPLDKLDGICSKIADFVIPRWRSITILGILATVVMSYFHLQVKPHYRLSDQVPDTDVAMKAMDLVDNRLSGAQQINIMVTWPKNLDFASPEVQAAIGEAHRVLQSRPQIKSVSSLETIRLYLKHDINQGDKSSFRSYVEKLPDNLRNRYLNEQEHTALVTGQIGDLGASQIAPILHDIKPMLANLRQEYPGVKFTMAGLTVLSSLQSTKMITQLNLGFMMAIGIVIVLLGFAFRSVDAALLSTIPNIFPIVTVGSYIYLSGNGLEYASVMGLTLAFGLAVDDTIHFLNRYILERRRSNDEDENVRETIAHLGPVLALTTLVLLCGLSVTSLSDLPVTRIFGELSMATLTAALVGDMLILPALILAARKLKPFGHDFALVRRRKQV